MAGDDLYICPAGESLTYRYTNEEHGLVLRRYWTNACPNCPIKHSCTPGKERRITRLGVIERDVVGEAGGDARRAEDLH
jgi:hypothetical protein